MSQQSDRQFDLIVFGATGYTGQHVASTLWAKAKKSEEPAKFWSGLRWAIAGRSKAKLDTLLAELKAKHGSLPAPVGVVVADVGNEESLRSMASQTRLVMNCTGPYRFYGEAVVESCIASKCDYIDLCGEPEFMDRTALLCHDKAASQGVVVVHGCAFDSVPADVGTLFSCMQFPKPGKCAQVQMYHTFGTTAATTGASAHATTFYAAVHGFGAIAATRRQRRQLLEKLEEDKPGSSKGPQPLLGAAKLKVNPGPQWQHQLKKYAFLFPGADAAVVRSTQRFLTHHAGTDRKNNQEDGENDGEFYMTPQFGAYFCVNSMLWAGVVAVVGSVFGLLAKFAFGRRFLLAHPRLFTLGLFTDAGPTQATLDAGLFKTTFVARGWSSSTATGTKEEEQAAAASGGGSGGQGNKAVVVPYDRQVVCSVSGPEPGYIGTSLIFAAVAQTLLEDRAALVEGLPASAGGATVDNGGGGGKGGKGSTGGGVGKGGVFTPGALMGSAGPLAMKRFIKRCSAVGIEFTVDEEGPM